MQTFSYYYHHKSKQWHCGIDEGSSNSETDFEDEQADVGHPENTRLSIVIIERDEEDQ